MSKSMKLMALVAGLSLTGTALACLENGKGGLLPENDAYIPVEVTIPGTASEVGVKPLFGFGQRKGSVTEAQFHQAIDQIEAVYAPIVAGMGSKLNIKRFWADGVVNAYAMQLFGSMDVLIYGGLARHKAITKDGLSLIVCHEIGHHIGGAPKKIGGPIVNWASNEGQADYFATLKCLRKAWINDNNEAIVRSLNAPKTVEEMCKRAHGNDRLDAALCIRTSMAGKSVADLFSSMSKIRKAKFTSPDSKTVWATDDNHPAPQCRLDTYFQGSLCDVNMNEDLSQTDEVKATCHRSLGHSVGKRPLCWFRPSR